MGMSRLGLLVVLAVSVWGTHAAAQNAPAPPPQPAPASPTAPRSEQPSPAAACYPLCRPGFLCHVGQCISACNPPCGAGQSCSADARCVADAPPPPPAYPPVYPQPPLYAHPEAEPSPPAHVEGREQHDGFMLRLTLGVGGGGTNFETDDGADMNLTGVSGSFGIDIGGALTENLVLHGRLSSFTLFDPKVELGGQDLGRAEDASVTANLFAAGLTYYFMPVNIYLTGAVGVSWLSASYRGDDGRSTDAGLGVNLDVGKEFWVGDNWGLGIAGQFWWSTLTEEDGGIESHVSMIGGAVLFSATYQ
jgi:hypothetical protein